MIKIINYSREKKKIVEYFNKRNIFDFIPQKYYTLVTKIINDVNKNGDNSLKKYALKFDKVKLTNLKVSSKQITLAYNIVKKKDPDFLNSFKTAIKNIHNFHSLSFKKSFIKIDENDILLGELVRPINSVGIYVPGGAAPLVSTLSMNVIPAQIAGVKKINVITPPDKTGNINEYILTAAKMLNVKDIYISGGAQAVAALAFGTETIPKVEKITGPGNIFVTLAKKLVYGIVDIDMLAGPSELVIVADNKTNENFIAADLMSQSEHGSGLETSIAILFSKPKVKKVLKQLQVLLETAPRKKEILNSLKKYGMVIVVKSMKQAVDLINIIAPEHLELMVDSPERYLSKIKNAGAIFLGRYTPETLGDYAAGPNHTLPTTGTAKFFSPLSVDTFLKSSNIIKYSKETLKKVSKVLIKIAETETLYAHSQSVKERLK